MLPPPTRVRFTKMQGAGNDFVVLDATREPLALGAEEMRRLGDRRFGIGEDDVIRHILDWSALPGASRHQWGTEIDVVDGAVMPPGYKPRLLPDEVAEGGLFAPLHRWLDAHIHEHGFFRPYARWQGGMFPEPWHLSYAPVSMRAIDDLTLDVLCRATAASDLPGKARVLELLPQILDRHVRNIVPPPPDCRW